MDPDDPIFAHQNQVVKSLAKVFQDLIVITSKYNAKSSLENINIYNYKWKTGHDLENSIVFFITWLYVVFKHRPRIIFSHMTEVQSALVAPIARLIGIKHYLWYAHATRSKTLNWNLFWLNGIVTSTKGSIPICNRKISYIGQGIDENRFPFKVERNRFKAVNYGRFDKSKNIATLIDNVGVLREEFPKLTLTIYGLPSSARQMPYYKEILMKYHIHVSDGWLKFQPNVPQIKISNELSEYGIFIHAFQGSLDKTLIEATLQGISVVTLNKEFATEFGTWSAYTSLDELNLRDELDVILRLGEKELYDENQRRYTIAMNNHNLDGWIRKLNSILRSS